MKLKLTQHFQDMMQFRSINLDHVKLAVREPDSVKPTYDNKKLARKAIGEKVIEVVYLEGIGKRKEYLIITAYYL